MTKRTWAALVAMLACIASARDSARAEPPKTDQFKRHDNRYIIVRHTVYATVYNEFAPGRTLSSYVPILSDVIPALGRHQYSRSFDVEFSSDLRFAKTTLLVQLNAKSLTYLHQGNYGSAPPGACPDNTDPGCVTLIAYRVLGPQLGYTQGYAPTKYVTDDMTEVHLAARISTRHYFAGLSYLVKGRRSFGYPVVSGVGFGAERDADLAKRVSVHGGLWFYPDVHGTYQEPTDARLRAFSGARFDVGYSVLTYRIGVFLPLRGRAFVDVSFDGTSAFAGRNAPSSEATNKALIGIGIAL